MATLDGAASDSVDLELFDADIALLHPDATSISFTDLFFAQDARRSRCWTGRHTRSPASSARPSPTRRCSGWSRTSSTTSNSKSHVATSTRGSRRPNRCHAQSRRCSSRSTTRRSRATGSGSSSSTSGRHHLRDEADRSPRPRLQERVPETRGFYWERSPHVTLQHDAAGYDALAEIPRVDKDGHWNDASAGGWAATRLRGGPAPPSARSVSSTSASLSRKPGPRRRPAPRTSASALETSPFGATTYLSSRSRSSRTAATQPFYLVRPNTTIRPIRGVAVQIPVAETFTLRAGQAHYEFPLFQGDATERPGISRPSSSRQRSRWNPTRCASWT